MTTQEKDRLLLRIYILIARSAPRIQDKLCKLGVGLIESYQGGEYQLVNSSLNQLEDELSKEEKDKK